MACFACFAVTSCMLCLVFDGFVAGSAWSDRSGPAFVESLSKLSTKKQDRSSLGHFSTHYLQVNNPGST